MKELTTFDNPKNVKLVLGILYVSLIGLLVADFFVHKHTYFPWEGAAEFYAVYGFVAYVSLVLIAKVLRKLVERKEDYYE